MKKCQYCGADNRDDAIACYFCGRELGTSPFPPETNSAPTQPMRAQAYTPPTLPPYPYQPNQPQPIYSPPPSYIPPPAPARTRYGIPERMLPLVMGLVGLVFLCVLGLAVLTISTLASSPAAQTTKAARGLPGMAATEFAPTEVAVVDPPTPWPSVTPQPDTAPTEAVDSSLPPVAQQDSEVKKLLSPECSSSLDTVGTESKQISAQPTILLDSNWRENFTKSLDNMKVYCGSLESASPVPQLVTDARRDLSAASSEFDQAKQLFNEGMENWSPSKLLEAGQHVKQASQYLDQAIVSLEKIGK